MEIKEEKAVFIGLIKSGENERKIKEYLDELEFLAETAGVHGDRKFVQKMDQPLNSTYIGSGKLEEIASYCEENGIEYEMNTKQNVCAFRKNIHYAQGMSSTMSGAPGSYYGDTPNYVYKIYVKKSDLERAKEVCDL